MKDVKEWEGLYAITENGKVWSYPKAWVSGNNKAKRKHDGRWMKTFNLGGYINVKLECQGKRKTFGIHQLIAAAYIPNPHNLKEINHKNGRKDDNRIENLEWCTHRENMRHCYRILGKKSLGERTSSHKLTNNQVKLIRAELLKGKLQTELAVQFKVHSTTIWAIKHQKSWNHI